MESNENLDGIERLLELGFTLSQIERLCQLRRVNPEREQTLAEQRRLEFARWLVATGRLTDELPTRRHGNSHLPVRRGSAVGHRGNS